MEASYLLSAENFNTDFTIGKKLFNIFKQQGLIEVSPRIVQPILLTEEEKNQLWLGAEEIASGLINAGFMTQEEITKLVNELKDYVKNDDYLIGYCQYIQIMGKLTKG